MIAYFCNEFAIDNDLPTYAGGLGILSGDLIHQAASEDYPMVGIGLLYKGKHYIQHITGDGKEEKRDSEFDHDTSFLRPTTLKGKPLVISLPSPIGEAKYKIYQLRLSDHTTQYFLSTDVDGNPQEWIDDMNTLYGGDIDSQIRQQILLGIGGYRLLKALNIKPTYYHLNEGRAGFLIWEMIADVIKKEHIPFAEAIELAKKRVIYTNHTLVSAGNPHYPLGAIKYWSEPISKELGLDAEEMVSIGVEGDGFSITNFAMDSSSKHTAVSKVHGKYAKQMYPQDNWISITNGVYMNRWQDSDYRNPALTDMQLWNQHIVKKRELMESVIKRTGFGYDYNRLVITWARRLAEYKQPMITFSDLDRLKSIIQNQERPVQLLFAGNSHAADPGSKNLVEEVVTLFSTELSGSAIFVPNYNISLANHLTSGSDLWLNTPKDNLEACGTSGMKAIANGVLNCTVLDGWTYEVVWDEMGWVLDPARTANDFYEKLEHEIIPMYYERDTDGLPSKWIARMRASINTANRFSTSRMLQEYKRQLYT